MAIPLEGNFQQIQKWIFDAPRCSGSEKVIWHGTFGQSLKIRSQRYYGLKLKSLRFPPFSDSFAIDQSRSLGFLQAVEQRQSVSVRLAVDEG
jgi:hypothetical protein